MNTFKHAATIIVLSAAGMISTQTFAAEAGVKTTPAPQKLSSFSQDDINGMFEMKGKPMQMAELSGQEMKETKGAILPIIAGAAVGGLLSGAYQAGKQYYMNGSVTDGRAVGRAVAVGTLGTGLAVATGGASSVASGVGSAASAAGKAAAVDAAVEGLSNPDVYNGMNANLQNQVYHGAHP